MDMNASQNLSKKYCKDFGNLLSNYFISIARNRLLSREELWEELLTKKSLKHVPEDKITLFQDILRGEHIYSPSELTDSITYGDGEYPFTLIALEKLNKESNRIFNPKITVLTSGFFNDVVVNGENIVIGLDYFLPTTNKYKPRDLPSYILNRYSPENINATSLSTYLSQFNLVNESDLTLINEMISFGKLYYVVSKLLPCTEERIVLGYSNEEYNLIQNNEAFIYSYFLQNEILFEESNIIKQKYLSERPSTFEISQSVPGRVGRWLGWKIVSSFMSSSTYTLEELLKEDDYKNIFYNSNYNPI